MQHLDTNGLLQTKDEETRVQIAQRVGLHLCDGGFPEADRRAAELLARALAEDAVEMVRRELSRALAHARHLPRDLALKLAHDVDQVSCPFLEVTDVFLDSDWQQLVLTLSRGALAAVARRKSISKGLANSLAEVGNSIVIETLLENPAAPMTRPACLTIMDRFSSEVWVLDKMALRDDLISEIAVELATIVTAAAREKLAKTYKLPEMTDPLVDEAETEAIFRIVKQTSKADLMAIARTLKKNNELKPALVLKALREHHFGFLEAAVAVLSEKSVEHARSVLLRAGPDAVKQLLVRAWIPESLHDDFWEALQDFRQQQE